MHKADRNLRFVTKKQHLLTIFFAIRPKRPCNAKCCILARNMLGFRLQYAWFYHAKCMLSVCNLMGFASSIGARGAEIWATGTANVAQRRARGRFFISMGLYVSYGHAQRMVAQGHAGKLMFKVASNYRNGQIFGQKQRRFYHKLLLFCGKGAITLHRFIYSFVKIDHRFIA